MLTSVSRSKKPLPRIARRRSDVHGFGVFAREPITKNRRIIDYAGELIRNSVSEARYSRDDRGKHCIALVQNRGA